MNDHTEYWSTAVVLMLLLMMPTFLSASGCGGECRRCVEDCLDLVGPDKITEEECEEACEKQDQCHAYGPNGDLDKDCIEECETSACPYPEAPSCVECKDACG